MDRIISSSLPLTFVIPGPSSQNHSTYLEVATIAANNLLSYLRIDSELAFDTHMVKEFEGGRIGENNLVILGGTDNTFGDVVLSKTKSEVQWLSDGQGWLLHERVFDKKGLGMLFAAGSINASILSYIAQASPFCINIQRRPLPWRCLYPQHPLTALIESCAYSLFVLESQCLNGSWSVLMQMLEAQVGYWAQGKQLLHTLSQRSTTQWSVQMVGSRVEVERSTVLDRRMMQTSMAQAMALLAHRHGLCICGVLRCNQTLVDLGSMVAMLERACFCGECLIIGSPYPLMVIQMSTECLEATTLPFKAPSLCG